MKKLRQPAPEPTSAEQFGADPPDDGPETGPPELDSDVGPSHARGSSTRSSPSSSPVDPRAAAADQLEQLAASGNLKAIRMVADGMPAKLRGEDSAEEPVKPHVAAAAIAAGLHVAEMTAEQGYEWIRLTIPARRPPG